VGRVACCDARCPRGCRNAEKALAWVDEEPFSCSLLVMILGPPNPWI
jgi:hypothetical protein